MDPFDGDPRLFPDFISTFKAMIHDVVRSDAQRLSLLRTLLTKRVRDEVGSVLTSPDAYWTVLQRLEQCYGLPHLVTQAHIGDLMQVKPIQSNDRPALLSFIQKVNGTASLLQNSDYAHELKSGVVLGHLVAKLPLHVQGRWSRHQNFLLKRGIDADVSHLSDWLADVAMAERLLASTKPPEPFAPPRQQRQDKPNGQKGRDYSSSKPDSHRTPTVMATKVKKNKSSGAKGSPADKPAAKPTCFACSAPRHSLFICDAFNKLDAAAREKLVVNTMRCFCCLSDRHKCEDCPSEYRCRVASCGGKHHTLLHGAPSSSVPPKVVGSTGAAEVDGKGGTFSAIQVAATSHKRPEQVALLAVVELELRLNGRSVRTYGLLDDGANGSLVRDDVAAALGVPGRNRPLRFNTFHSSDPYLHSREANFEVAIPGSSEFFNVDAYTTPELNLDRSTLNWKLAKEKWPYLAGLPPPAPPDCDIGVLIGMDVINAHIQREIISPPPGMEGPYAVRTDLGWCFIGPVHQDYVCSSSELKRDYEPSSPSQSCFSIVRPEVTPGMSDEALHNLVLDYFKVESVGTRKSTSPMLTAAERRALDYAERTVQHDKVGGSYSVGIPKISDDASLPNNYVFALQMFNRQRLKFARQPALAKSFSDQMEFYCTNLARRVTPEEAEAPHPRRNLLLHHGVTHEAKPGKVRVVCNGSSVYKGKSLNGILLPGPNLLNDMPIVITRLREFPVWVTSDIIKFFHHVGVVEEDQMMFCFLWSPLDSSDPPQLWCMMYQPFGSIASPFLSLFCLNRCAEDAAAEFPWVVEMVRRAFYMDNFCYSFPTVEEAKQKCLDLAIVLRRGNFHLNEWASNSREVLAQFPASQLSVPFLDLETEQLPTGRMLGLFLNPNTDTFGYRVRIRPEADTKRAILREVASQSDPLGLILPVTITARALLQDIWLSGSKWDEPIASPLLVIWKKWAEELHHVANLQIPRLLVPLCEEIDLHSFGDACETAFGAALYARAEVAGTVSVNLVAARANVGPIKPLTIPKLELQAAVSATRIAGKFGKELRLKVRSITYWTDSETTLRRIRSQKCRYQVFEANRLGEIKEETSPEQWRHVPGLLNPADDLSRGVAASSLHAEHRWYRGPSFLYEPESNWPQTPAHEEPSWEDPDVKKPKWINALRVGASKETPRPISTLITDSNSLVKLKRVVAWVRRFIHNCRASREARASDSSSSSSKRSGFLSVQELDEALTECVKISQEESFHDAVYDLHKGRSVHPSTRLAPLSPFLDRKGVMRAGGRLRRAPLPFSGRHPVILDPRHHLTRLIVFYFHIAFFHAKTEHLLGKIRQHYLILRGRRAIRNLLTECVPCKRAHAPPEQPSMADLPMQRLTPDYPFTYVGTDYFGPLYVKQGRSIVKRYGVLFTCLATRSIHLEKAYSMTQDSFINAYRRFVSYRGRCSELWCDNGTNLTAGERELREALEQWDEDTLNHYMTDRGTTFHFSPPAGPNFGGAWEKLVASSKNALKAVLTGQTVTDEVLDTVLAEVAALLNGRPLTHVSVDPEDLEPLTPNHFLLGRPQPHLPPAPESSCHELSKREWRQAQALIDQFWRRWMEEYVPTLIERRKWLASRRNLQEGDVVLVVEPNTPRGIWPMGRVQQVHPGPDGVVRVATVRTMTGIYVRPVSKLCILLEAKRDPASLPTAVVTVPSPFSATVPPGIEVVGDATAATVQSAAATSSP